MLSLILQRSSDGAHLDWLFDGMAGFADKRGEGLWGPVGVAGRGADADVPHEVLARVLGCSRLGQPGGEEVAGVTDGQVGQADLLQGHAPAPALHRVGKRPAVAREHKVRGADTVLIYPPVEVMPQVIRKGG